MPDPILPKSFYGREPRIVAQELLGKVLVSTICGTRTSGVIVETEAYLSSRDSACHGYHGRQNKNAMMFGPAAFAYVYPIHANYCFNVVTEEVDLPSAVLIRALQPLDNITRMKILRGQDDQLSLCSGPGKLCQSLSIGIECNGIDLTTRRSVWIEEPATQYGDYQDIVATTRIGVTSAKRSKLRYVFRNNRFASGTRKLNDP